MALDLAVMLGLVLPRDLASFPKKKKRNVKAQKCNFRYFDLRIECSPVVRACILGIMYYLCSDFFKVLTVCCLHLGCTQFQVALLCHQVMKNGTRLLRPHKFTPMSPQRTMGRFVRLGLSFVFNL